MTERFLRRTPQSNPKALAFFREKPEIFNECLKRSEKINAALEELKRINELPAAIDPQKYLDHQKRLYDEVVFPSLVKYIHYDAGQRPKPFSFCLGDRIADMIFGLLPEETIREACAAIVPTTGAVTTEEREKLKAKVNREIETAKKYIIDKIPAELLHEAGNGDFIRSPLYVAFSQWSELQRTMTEAADPWGMSCPPESPWYGAHRVLNLRPNFDGGRFEPTRYDPDFHRS